MSDGLAPDVWVDGQPATVEQLALVATRNYGHYTTMWVRGGAVRGLENHLRRVDAAHRELFGHGLDTDLVRRRWAEAAAHQPDALVRATFYDTPDGEPHVMITATPGVSPAARPQRLMSVQYARPFAHLKHLGTFAQLNHRQQVQRAGFDDALLLTPEGEITETATANIGFVRGDQVTWPAAPTLPGTGLQLLAAALPASGWSVQHGSIRGTDLPSFDGAFVVNSIGVVPVAQIDDHTFHNPEDVVGPIVEAHSQLPWDHL